MASLFKRKDSPYWYISWYNPDTKMAGAPISTRTGDKREAMRIMRKFEASILADKPLLKEKQLTISAAWEFYMKNKPELASHTVSIARIAVNNLIKSVGDIYINDFGSKESLELQLYFAETELSKSSVGIYIRAIKSFFEFFVDSEYIPKNYIKAPKKILKDIEPIPQPHLDKIFQSMGKENSFMFRFLLITGLRVGEALAMELSDIDFDKWIIRYRNFKAKKAGIKPIITPLYELLRDNLTERQGKLFHYTNYTAAYRYWSNTLEALSLDYNIHQLRKTCASYLANLGVDIFRVQAYIGHTDVKTTLEHYAGVNLEIMRNEINKKIENNSPSNRETT